MTEHILDRPVWNALHTGWANVAQASGQAGEVVRLNPDFGPFAAMADSTRDTATILENFIPEGGEFWLVESQSALANPAGLAPVRQAELVQMLATDIRGDCAALDIVPLGEEEAAEMLALATLTRPGPFARHTNRLAEFVGIKDEGRLVAMCGERMQLPGYSELSGLCTLPDYRGRGYGAGLMRYVSRRILERGDTVFLHAYAANTATVALYESLGFAIRTRVTTSIFARDS